MENQKITKSELKKLYEKTKKELIMMSEITNAMMQSLELDQVIFTILTALTSHEVLGFDRAMFFLVNKKKRALKGRMALGPHSADEADKLWKNIEVQELTLKNIIKTYNKFKDTSNYKLNNIVKDISIPLKEDSGIIALTVLEGMHFEINNEEAKKLVNDDVKKQLKLNYFITVPLKTKNQCIGAIVVDNIYSKRDLTKDDMRIVNMFADHAALAIENSRLYEESVHLARTDWLTGLWNTRYFNEVLKEKLIMAQNEKTCLSLLMIDIDNFKAYNDTFGHQEGDLAIKKVAQVLRKCSRQSDFACRYGGEEFSLIMYGIQKSQAEVIAERLRVKVQDAFNSNDSIPDDLKLTVSLGLAVFPVDSDKKDALINKADSALYHAKQSGKNKTCMYTTELEQILAKAFLDNA